MRPIANVVTALWAILAASDARAVDITGTWAVCLSGGTSPFCPPSFVGRLVSSGGEYVFTLIDGSVVCTVTGDVDPVTGAMSVDPGGCGPVPFSMNATATDTSITGTATPGLCSSYALQGVKVCEACNDAAPCTVDGCGTTPCSTVTGCTYAPDHGASCEDGDACTTGDVCDETVCVAGTDACDDGDPCTIDACDAGSCTHAPVPCGACERCDAGLCVVGPKAGCRQSLELRKSRLTLKDHPNDDGDKVSWAWGAGAATTSADFGDPPGGDAYRLCVFDSAAPAPRLLLDATAPGGGTCEAGTSCWRAKGNPPGIAGFQYKDTGLLLPDGVKSVKLKPGVDVRAKATVKGQGQNLQLPSPMGVTLPVTVQLQAANGTCFETIFTSARTDREDLFKASGE